MKKRPVNYDRIAPGYDQRYVYGQSEGVRAALLALVRTLGAGRILEVGCGTGHWLEQLGPIAHRLVGLDQSAGMLDQARKRKSAAQLARGDARRLPFTTGYFDLVFCVNALHHFGDPPAFISEAFRLLRPGGALAVVGMDPHRRRDRWYVYRYFGETFEGDLERFPAWDTILGWMLAEGFAGTGWQVVERILDDKLGRRILRDPFLAKDSSSQLALLTDEAYAAGLQQIEMDLQKAEARGETLVFETDISLAMLTGYRATD